MIATSEDVTDFFHKLYANGLSARTVDQAKSSVVNLYKNLKVDPNPAQKADSKTYVTGILKFNRVNNMMKNWWPVRYRYMSCHAR